MALAGLAPKNQVVAGRKVKAAPPPDGKLPKEPSNDPASFPSGNKG